MPDQRNDIDRESSTLAAVVAPEDLQRGDYVSLLNEVQEFPSWLWNGETQLLPGQEMVRVQMPARKGGKPLKVEAICLPFVLLKTPKGKFRTIDLRLCQLVRLSSTYAKRAWIASQNKRKKKDRPANPTEDNSTKTPGR